MDPFDSWQMRENGMVAGRYLLPAEQPDPSDRDDVEEEEVCDELCGH